MREYEIYHDESKEGGYWHSFVFIPTDKKEEIFNHLISVKEKINSGIQDLSFKGLSKAKQHHAKPKLIKYWLSYITAGLQQRKKYQEAMAYLCLENGVSDISEYLNIKIVILKIRDNHLDMFESMLELERIETTMRIGLKGGLHYLFSDEEIQIKNIYVDGDEHYYGLYGRSLDEKRIVD